jgi:hypothetical protein
MCRWCVIEVEQAASGKTFLAVAPRRTRLPTGDRQGQHTSGDFPGMSM